MAKENEPQPISSKSGDLVAALEEYLGIPPYTTRVVIDINIETGATPIVYYETIGTEGLVDVIKALPPTVIVSAETQDDRPRGGSHIIPDMGAV